MNKLAVFSVTALILFACAGTSTQNLKNAEKALIRARDCEEVRKYAAAELRDAQTAYDEALASLKADDVYIAKRKADLALARGKSRLMQEKYDRLSAKKKESSDEMARLKAELMEKERLLKEREAEEAKTREELANAMKGLGEVRQEERGLVLYISDILFDFGKADLKPGTVDSLVKISTVLINHPRYNIRVEGHTDSVGSAQYNQKLSFERAKKVADFFVDKGVDEKRVAYVGYGKDKPLVSNITAEGRQRNRRVEIIVAE